MEMKGLEQQDSLLIADYISSTHDDILKKWLSSAQLSRHDPFYEEVIKNGQETIRLVHSYFVQPDHDAIIQLTKKVATERIAANVDIGQFIDNINLGREIVNKCISDSNLPSDVKIKGILGVDELFDFYMYYAVQSYTVMKDEIIHNKNQFIEEMNQDRLTILGQVAKSFAHEIRNPLTSIKGFLSLLEQKYAKKPEDSMYFSIIQKEMNDLENQVSRFLYLTKIKGLDDQIKVVNFSVIVDELTNLMSSRFNEEKIMLEKQIEEDCFVMGDEEQLKQVALNILNNALEVLTKKKETRLVKVDMKKQGEKVILKFSNNGDHIPDYLLENIFEPFITTKKLAAGLGLSVCKQIVEKHQGTITAISEEGMTSFVVEMNSTSPK